MAEYSYAEKKLFAQLGYYYLANTSLNPCDVWRIVAEEVFISGATGIAVEALRNGFRAIKNGKPYRMTPEFDGLIVLEKAQFTDRCHYEWDEVIQSFREGKMNIHEWNCCIHKRSLGFDAYIMGSGAEQLLVKKEGFKSEQEVKDFYKELGVEHTLYI